MGVNIGAIAEVASSTLDKEKQKFDALSEEEKEQKFLSTIDDIKMSQDFQNFESRWKKQGVKKKMQYYKDGEVISVKGSVNYALKAPGTLDVSLNPLKRPRVRGLPNPVMKHINPKKNIEESVETSIYEQFPWLMRIGVDLGLLKKPWTLSKKTLLKNIATDANTLDKNLKTFRQVCKYVPQLMAIGALIEKFLPYTTWYKERGAELIQEKIQNGNKRDVEKSTTYSLSHMEQSIVKSEIEGENSTNSNNPVQSDSPKSMESTSIEQNQTTSASKAA